MPHCSTLCTGYLWEFEVHLRQAWSNCSLQGRTNTEDVLVSPNDKDTMTKKNSVIYWYRYDKIDHDEEYIGDSSRMLGDRYRQHLNTPSSILDHQIKSGHTTTVEDFKITGREGTIWPGPSKKPYTLQWKTLPWKETLESTICHIFGTEFCIPSKN